jgi:hypothetical protein
LEGLDVASISPSTSLQITIPAGRYLVFAPSGAGIATLGPGPGMGQMWALGTSQVTIGPFEGNRTLYVSCAQQLTYTFGAPANAAAATLNPITGAISAFAAGTGPTLVTDGNSLTALSGSPKTMSLGSITDLGWAGAAMGFLGQRLQWIANVAVSGQNIAQRLAAFATDVVPLSPTYVAFMEGRNSMVPLADGGGGLTLDQACSLTTAYVENALSFGIKVILQTHPTGSVKPASEPGALVDWNRKLMAYNRFCRFLAATTRGVFLVDQEEATLDPLSATCSPKANFIRAGNDPHMTAKGNYAMGRQFAAVMAPQIPQWSGLYRPRSNYDNRVSAASSTNVRALNSNPMVQGSGGTATGGITGTIASTFSAGVAAGTATTVGSVVARADGFGNDQQIVASGMSAACNIFIRPDSSEAISYVNSGDYLYGLCNVSVTGMTGIIGIELGIYLQAGSLLNTFGMQATMTAAADFDQTDVTDFWIATPISQFNLSAAVGLVYPRLNVYGVAGGGATIKCGRMTLVNCGPQGLLAN